MDRVLEKVNTKNKFLKNLKIILMHIFYYFRPIVQTTVRRVCIVVAKVHRWNYSKIRAAPEKSDYDR